jgi:hypothetical protein
VVAQHLVERAVLAAMHGLLADEAGDRLRQGGIVDPRALSLDRVDEEPFALGEQHRQRGEERGGVGTAIDPVARHGGGLEGEVDVAARDHGPRVDRRRDGG